MTSEQSWSPELLVLMGAMVAEQLRDSRAWDVSTDDVSEHVISSLVTLAGSPIHVDESNLGSVFV